MNRYYVQYTDCREDSLAERFVLADDGDEISFYLAEEGHYNIEVFDVNRIEALYAKMTDPNAKFEPLESED